jgi:Ni,Fe-hydrogenase III small subunit
MWQIIKQITRAGIATEAAPEPVESWHTERQDMQQAIQQEILSILGRALCIRAVDAGSCNACELELHALNNPYYNIEGLGIKFVASPRHADMLLVTGVVTKNMAEALQLAYDAVPHPKLVVAIGACACTGGIFGETYASCGNVANVLPVNVTVPGCPPPPIDILRGILTAVSTQKHS